MIESCERRWELLNFASAENRGDSLRRARSVMPKDGIGARSANIEWKLGPSPDWTKIRAYVLTEGEALQGWAPFYEHDWPLVFRLGEIAIGSAPINRLVITGDLHFVGEVPKEGEAIAISNLIRAALSTLKPRESLYFEGLPVDSATYAALTGSAASSRGVVTIQLGAAFDHQFIKLPSSFKQYLQELGPRSRQSLQYSSRRLDKDMSGQVQTRKFDRPDQVNVFLADAASVSRKTYQASLLSLGLRDDSETRSRLNYAAEQGWFRSYILYCQDVPCAFMLGFQYGGCYYYDDVGYDPAYGKWSVGSVLQLKVIEEMLGSANPPALFDFSIGYGSHKGRFGNLERREVNLLVLRRTWRNRLLAIAYRGTEGISDGVVRVLDRLGVKKQLKRFIRKLSTSLSEGR